MRKVAIQGFTARYLYIRGDGNYVYRRVIPANYRILANGKREFKESLRTRKHTDAIARYGEMNAKYEVIFDQLKNGIALNDQREPSVDELKAWAKVHRVSYKSVDAHIANPNDRDMATRLGKWIEAGKPTDMAMDAFFGSLPDETTIKKALEVYEKQNRDSLIGLTSREKSKKLTPVRGAVDRFVTFAKRDIPLKAINRAMANEYRSHLIDLMEAGSIQANTANKLLMHVRKVITFYIDNMDESLPNPFASIRVKEEKAKRPAFTVAFIKTKWLTDDPFSSLNEQARGALFAMIDTGCGPKEICGLAPEDIQLNDYRLTPVGLSAWFWIY